MKVFQQEHGIVEKKDSLPILGICVLNIELW